MERQEMEAEREARRREAEREAQRIEAEEEAQRLEEEEKQVQTIIEARRIEVEAFSDLLPISVISCDACHIKMRNYRNFSNQLSRFLSPIKFLHTLKSNCWHRC